MSNEICIFKPSIRLMKRRYRKTCSSPKQTKESKMFNEREIIREAMKRG